MVKEALGCGCNGEGVKVQTVNATVTAKLQALDAAETGKVQTLNVVEAVGGVLAKGSVETCLKMQ